jgi:hypothetical protein
MHAAPGCSSTGFGIVVRSKTRSEPAACTGMSAEQNKARKPNEYSFAGFAIASRRKPQRAARAGAAILAEHPNWDNSNDFNEDKSSEIPHTLAHVGHHRGAENRQRRRAQTSVASPFWQNKPIAEKPNDFSLTHLEIASPIEKPQRAHRLAGVLAERTQAEKPNDFSLTHLEIAASVEKPQRAIALVGILAERT